jgi:hypothetical protein
LGRAAGRGRVCRVSARWRGRASSCGRGEIPAHPGRGQPSGRGGAFPGAAQVGGERQAETRKLAEIRAVLAAFDWEFGDRQLALERIEQLACEIGGQQ